MKQKRKRAPGGGRKPNDASGPGAPFSVRLPEDVLNQLRVAADKRGTRGTVSEELVRLLRFALSEKAARDKRSKALRGLFTLMDLLDRDIEQMRPGDWQSSPYAFGVFRGGVMQFLDELRPRGEITLPAPFPEDDPFPWSDDPEDDGR